MPLPTQRAHADLSESALAYATKKIEVEEVDFSVEINGLMGGKDISERVFGAVGGYRKLGRTCGLQHTAPIGGRKWGAAGWQGGGRRRGGGEWVCCRCLGRKPPGLLFT